MLNRKIVSGLLLLVAFIAIAYYQFPLYSNNATKIEAVGISIAHSALIFLFYLVGEFTVEDGKYRTRARVFWFVTDKVILPVLVMLLVFRHDASIFYKSVGFWILLFIIVDPFGVIGKTISQSKGVREGYFFRGVSNGETRRGIDYVSALIVLVILFWLPYRL